jgi:hypothetical protein
MKTNAWLPTDARARALNKKNHQKFWEPTGMCACVAMTEVTTSW